MLRRQVASSGPFQDDHWQRPPVEGQVVALAPGEKNINS